MKTKDRCVADAKFIASCDLGGCSNYYDFEGFDDEAQKLVLAVAAAEDALIRHMRDKLERNK